MPQARAFGTVTFSIFGDPPEICQGCDVVFEGDGGRYRATSSASGAYSLTLPAGGYDVFHVCPSVVGGEFLVEVMSPTSVVLNPGDNLVDVLQGVCL